MNIVVPKYEGPLERKTNKWKEYHVVLKGGQLYFYKDRSTNANLLGTLELSVTTFCNPEKGVLVRGYQFSVSTPSTETHLRANSAELRDKWIKEIMSAVTELNNYRPQHMSIRSQSGPLPETQVYDSTLVVHVGKVEHEWYWPSKSRDQADTMLRAVDKCHFLVRDSGQEHGSYSLSVGIGGLENKQVFHYMIKRDHTENKFILVPAPDKRFDTLSDVIDFYLNLNREMELVPLKNPAHRACSVRGNMAPNGVTQGAQNPCMEQEDTEYVRLGKYASNENKSTKQDASPDSEYLIPDAGSPQKPPKPVRPGGSNYMNVDPAFKGHSDGVITSTSNKDGNYIYAAVGPPPLTPNNHGNSPSNNGNMVTGSPGECLMIRGDVRSTPAVARFGSSSMFEDAVQPPPADSCYVNFEINTQMGNVNIGDDKRPDRPKSSGKSSAKAGKNKQSKDACKNTYYGLPPASDGLPGYNDPSLSMSTPPSHKQQGGHRAHRDDLPPAATQPIAYKDPVLSMTTPPSTPGHRVDMYPPASNMISYNDPGLSMTKVPARVKNAARLSGNV